MRPPEEKDNDSDTEDNDDDVDDNKKDVAHSIRDNQDSKIPTPEQSGNDKHDEKQPQDSKASHLSPLQFSFQDKDDQGISYPDCHDDLFLNQLDTSLQEKKPIPFQELKKLKDTSQTSQPTQEEDRKTDDSDIEKSKKTPSSIEEEQETVQTPCACEEECKFPNSPITWVEDAQDVSIHFILNVASV